MSSYWEDIESEAQSIRDRFPDPIAHEIERDQLIRQFADGYVGHMDTVDDVLEHTQNEPDPGDVQDLMGPGDDWTRMKTLTAYLAAAEDLFRHLRSLDEEFEENAGRISPRKRWKPFGI
jgi:hypothetical protein